MSREYTVPELVFGTNQTGRGHTLSHMMDKLYDAMDGDES